MRKVAPAIVGMTVVLTLSLRVVSSVDSGRPVVFGAAQPARFQAEGIARFVIEPEALGDGWTIFERGVPPADPSVFVESASASYTGPDGARVLLHAYRAVPGRAAVVRSWEDVGAVFDTVRFGFGIYGQAERVVVSTPPCVDETRVGGDDRPWNLPVGVTMCAVDPDVIILVAVSGWWNGQSGAAASDAVAQRAANVGLGLEGEASPSSPVASPVAATPPGSPLATPVAAAQRPSAEADVAVPSRYANGIVGGAFRDFYDMTAGVLDVELYSFWVYAYTSERAARADLPLVPRRLVALPPDPALPDFSALQPASYSDVRDGTVALGGQSTWDGLDYNTAVVFVLDGRYIFGLVTVGFAADVFGEMEGLIEALPNNPEAAGNDLPSLLPDLNDMPAGVILVAEERIL